MSEFKKTWRLVPDGHLLGTIDIISPWTGRETEAVVDIDTSEVISAHGASCQPFYLVLPRGAAGEIFKGSLKAAPAAELIYGDGQKPEMGLITMLSDAEKEELARDIADELRDGDDEGEAK